MLQFLNRGGGSASFNFNGGTLQAGRWVLHQCSHDAGHKRRRSDFRYTAGHAATLSGLLSGPGGLTKVDSGTLTLAAANTFSGNTLVSGGTLALGSPQALQLSTLDTSGSGAVSFTSLSSATLGGLTGSGTLSLLKSVALSVGNNNVSTTFSGVLNGPGSLIKIGSGAVDSFRLQHLHRPDHDLQGELVVDGSLNSSDYSV